MSRKKKDAPITTAAAAAAARPWPATTLFTGLFLGASAFSWWVMRDEPGRAGMFDAHLAEVRARRFPNGVRLEAAWTGNGFADWLLTELVAAFIAAAAGWDPAARLLQAYLLVHFAAVVGLLAAEAGRARNAWRVLSFTSVWAVLYQLVGGAVICPLHFIAYLWASAGTAYFAGGREVSPSHARALLPALVLGYLAPTAAMYIPFADIMATQRAILFWQFAPILVNIITLFLSSTSLSSPPPSSAKGGQKQQRTKQPTDIQPLKRCYGTLFGVLALFHISTVIALALPSSSSSSDPQQFTFSHVFLPSYERRMENSIQALHWLFQWDLYGIFGTGLLWCLLAVYDVRRLLMLGKGASVGEGKNNKKEEGVQEAEGVGLVPALALMVAGTVVFGPGAAVAAVLYWREEKLVLVENRLRSEEVRAKGE
ncbi:hypothetical protein SLS62_006206 [Diatrype stigma]|uniref:Uncharacterized protein n=1 Tax=Diatrype stigma TaxID=117547 RepID=A0AAN9UNK9_9PEZI